MLEMIIAVGSLVFCAVIGYFAIDRLFDAIDPDIVTDRKYRIAVDDAIREFAANAIGDVHWDSDD